MSAIQIGRVTTRKNASVHLDAQRRWCPVLSRRGVRIVNPIGSTTPANGALCPWCFTSAHVDIAAAEVTYGRYTVDSARIERILGEIGQLVETAADRAAITARIAQEHADLDAAAAASAAADAAFDNGLLTTLIPAPRPSWADAYSHPSFVARRNTRITRTGRRVAA